MFVIANSLTVSKKAVSADWQYNMRVTECRLATVALALACGIPPARTLLHVLVVTSLACFTMPMQLPAHQLALWCNTRAVLQ